jgi:Helix-turn-helix domain
MTLLTIHEFCRKYRISRRTVWNWARAGRLRVLRDKGGRIFRLVDPQWPMFDESRGADLVDRYGALKPIEMAALLGVHPASIRRMVREGRLKPLYVDSQRRFSVAEARRALAERMLGRRPRGPKDTTVGMIMWAKQRLSRGPEETHL